MIPRQGLYMFIFLAMSFAKCFSQRQVVAPTDFITNAKIFFLNQDTSFYTHNETMVFLNDTSNYELLSSKGFSQDLIFMKIMVRGNFEAIRGEKIADSLYVKNQVPFSCDYVIAGNISAKKFYRLKGFTSNDFPQLFKNPYSKKDKDLFSNQFWISELDLACLFEIFFMNRKLDIHSSCMQFCNDRDKKFVIIKND